MGFNECPRLIDANSSLPEWIEIVAGKLGMPYFEIGSISSANHMLDWGTDITGNYTGKFKAILSKGPLTNLEDIELILRHGDGWVPASAFRAETKINSVKLAFYSLHIPGSEDIVAGSMHQDLADRVIPAETMENFVITGDFNDSAQDDTMQYIVDKGMRFTWDDIANQSNTGVDHILYNVSSRAHATEGGRIDPGLSDHPYVWSELLYPIPIVPIVKSENRIVDELRIKVP